MMRVAPQPLWQVLSAQIAAALRDGYENWEQVPEIKQTMLRGGTHATDLLWKARQIGLIEVLCQIPISSLRRVVEFGGGYGGMAGLIMKMNSAVDYGIIDLPVMTGLQHYYLKKLCVDHRLCTDPELVLNEQEAPSLFISCWGISEADAVTQDMIIKRWNWCHAPHGFVAAATRDNEHFEFERWHDSFPARISRYPLDENNTVWAW